jgi:hypothetical protein
MASENNSTTGVSSGAAVVSDEDGIKGLETALEDGGGFSSLPPGRFPLFATLSELLQLLDRTLPGGRFVPSDASSSARGEELSGLEAYFEGEASDDDNDTSDFDGEELGESGDGGKAKGAAGGDGPGEAPRREMTWVSFLGTVWRRLPSRLTKDGVEASLLWTEICSTLKGSVDALKVQS